MQPQTFFFAICGGAAVVLPHTNAPTHTFTQTRAAPPSGASKSSIYVLAAPEVATGAAEGH